MPPVRRSSQTLAFQIRFFVYGGKAHDYVNTKQNAGTKLNAERLYPRFPVERVLYG